MKYHISIFDTIWTSSRIFLRGVTQSIHLRVMLHLENCGICVDGLDVVEHLASTLEGPIRVSGLKERHNCLVILFIDGQMRTKCEF